MPPNVRQAPGLAAAQPPSAAQRAQPAAQRGQPAAETRVDAAHELANGRAEPRAADPYRAAVDTAYGLIDEGGLIEGLGPLRTQAEQLGVYLDQRQRQLDRRQAELDRKQADFESEVREARIWFTERREELTQQEERLSEAQRQLDQRAQRLAAAEAVSSREREQAEAGLRRLECDLQRRETELQARLARAEQQSAALLAAQEDFQRRREEHDVYLKSLRQQIDARREAVLSVARLALAGVERRRAAVEDEISRLTGAKTNQPRSPAEAGFPERLPAQPTAESAAEVLRQAAGREDLIGRRQELLAESERQRRQLNIDSRRFAQRRKRWRIRREAQQKLLAQYSEELDRRRLTVEETYTQASHMHREALELRLATEELQAQLAGAVGPALLDASIGQLRLRLAGHFQQEAALVEQRRAELESLKLEVGRMAGGGQPAAGRGK
jgi:hypothetical protein